MLEYASGAFALGAIQEDGETLLNHLESVWKQTGKKPKELDIGEINPLCINWWNWFNDLSSGRQSSGMGVNPLSFSEIKAWCELTDTKLNPQDVSIIKALDSKYLEFQAKEHKKASKSK